VRLERYGQTLDYELVGALACEGDDTVAPASVNRSEIPPGLLRQIEAVTAKRPRTVLDHILEHGHITTDELKERYGYNHPPRAARDVREQGIPLTTTRVEGPGGRRIAAYTLDLEAAADAAKAGGRRAFPKELKQTLVDRDGERCAICGTPFPARALQIDHRVPYEVAGDVAELDPADFMLVCGSCNRAKSWSCEHCENWAKIKEAALCESCMWASPTSYSHIALEERRSLTLTWVGEEVVEHDTIAEEAAAKRSELGGYVKRRLRERAEDG
jgi:HNH endonuclease/Helix-turn-helix domain